MNIYKLAIASLLQHKLRTAAMLLTIILPFTVYGVLGALKYSMYGQEGDENDSRLIVMHEQGIYKFLPISYRERIRTIKGVDSVGHVTWFGAYFKERKNLMMAFAVDVPVWFEQHPNAVITESHKESFKNTKNGIIVTSRLAKKYGWRVGDNVPINSILFFPKEASIRHWEVKVTGIFENGQEEGGRNIVLLHYDYMNDARSHFVDEVGTFSVTAKPGYDIREIARKIDDEFSTSFSRTSSTTDRQFHADFFNQFGNVAMLIDVAVTISFSSLFIVLVSTMLLVMNQRAKDISILKVIGFSFHKVTKLLLIETFLLASIGCVVGMGISLIVSDQMVRAIEQWPSVGLPIKILLEGVLLMLFVSLVTGFIPALRAYKIRPVEVLSRA